MNEWKPESVSKPATYLSVLVAGILEGESMPDCHEGFWTGRSWRSVRTRENDPLTKRHIKHVTHWMRRPKVPSLEIAESVHAGHQERPTP